MSSTRYRAFISYSHKDERWAKWLQHRLETFVIPRHLRESAGSSAWSGRRIRPVFRDSDELPASADIGESLRARLRCSSFLIVLVSKDASTSLWVDAEIRYFLELGRADRILVAIVGTATHDLGSPNKITTADLPPALRDRPPPLHVDLRVRGAERKRSVVRLAAGLLDTSFDDLWRRERRRTRKRLVLGVLALGTLVVLTSLPVLWRDQEAWREQVVGSAEDALKEQWSESGLQTDALRMARQAIVAALPADGSVVRTGRSIDRARAVIRQGGLRAATFNIRHSTVKVLRFSPGGNFLAAGTREGDVFVFCIRPGARPASMVVPTRPPGTPSRQDSPVLDLRFTADSSRLVAVMQDGRLWTWNVPTWDPRSTAELETAEHDSAGSARIWLSSDGLTASIVSVDGILSIADVSTGAIRSNLRLHRPGLERLVVAPDASHFLAVWSTGEVSLWGNDPPRMLGQFSRPGLVPLGLSLDGESIYKASLGSTQLLDARSGALVDDIPAVDCGTPVPFDLEPGDEFLTLINSYASAMAVSQDGESLALGYAGSNIEIGNSRHARPTLLLRGHESRIAALQFDEGSRMLASSSEDGDVRIWTIAAEADSGTEARAALCACAEPGELAFSKQQWNRDWHLRMRDPNPCRWRGLLSIDFWAHLPGDIVRALERKYTMDSARS